MKKKLKILTILLALNSYIFANSFESQQAEAKAWKDGFITAYKALKADSKIQGLKNEIIPLDKYIVYFDVSDKNMAQWDKLMIQMMGYTTSIHDPIRTTNDWIIFASFDNYGTAKQEMEMLNSRLFSNQKAKLQLFENNEEKTFLASKTLLSEDIKHLKEIMEKQSSLKLSKEINKKNKELDDNQKVAIVYIDKNTNKEIKAAEAKPFIEQPQNKTTATQTNTPVKKEPKKEAFNVEELPSPIGEFVVTEATVAYKLKDLNIYNTEPDVYNVEQFVTLDVVQKDTKKYQLGAIVDDKDGTSYYKIYRKNLFIDAKAAQRID
jgi:hypothetical protein